MLSTEDLALLEAIRETSSLSRAAAHLGKAPSTVSCAARRGAASGGALRCVTVRPPALPFAIDPSGIDPSG
jgi:hypothetical protein